MISPRPNVVGFEIARTPALCAAEVVSCHDGIPPSAVVKCRRIAGHAPADPSGVALCDAGDAHARRRTVESTGPGMEYLSAHFTGPILRRIPHGIPSTFTALGESSLVVAVKAITRAMPSLPRWVIGECRSAFLASKFHTVIINSPAVPFKAMTWQERNGAAMAAAGSLRAEPSRVMPVFVSELAVTGA
jgi:hypothetical protein